MKAVRSIEMWHDIPPVSGQRSRGNQVKSRPPWAVFILLLLPALAAGQLYTGSVAGTVNDPSGAVITDAQVKAVDQDKGFSFSAKTDSSGRYVIRQVPPGMYTITVEAAGFQTQHKEAVPLTVNENVSVNFALSLGAASEVMNVEATGVELQTQDAVTGQVVDRRFVNDLPLVGRSVLDLAYLTPGITEVDNACRSCIANNFISNGSRNATADILLDGVSSTNFEQNSGILAPTYIPSVDAVQEFKVQQSNFSAEYGFSGATLVNVLTRSGTNQFHGSLYEFIRNDKLDANDWFANHRGVARPPMRLNDFGGTLGGPIIRNKTFFFFDYEGSRRRSLSLYFLGVATLAEKTGDFGELCTVQGFSFDANGVCSNPAGQIYDPFTGSPDPRGSFAVNRASIPFNNLATYASPGNPALNGTPFQVAKPGTPGNLIDPVAAKLMALFPKPNLPIASLDDLHKDFFIAGTNRDSNNQFDIKVDHRFSDSKMISAKYAERRGNSHSLNCFGNEADPCTDGPLQEHEHLGAVNYTQVIGPVLVLTLSYGITRGAVHLPGISGDFPNINQVTELGFPEYMLASHYKQFPAISLDQYFHPGDSSIGTRTFSIIREGQETHTARGAIDWVRGNHELKFGVEMRVHRINFTQPGYPAGVFGFDCFTSASTTDPNSTDCSSGSNGGDAMASFLMGVGGGGVYEVPNDTATQSYQFGGFVQDNFRATPKLTLNLGLRYELSLPRTDRYNRMNWLDPNLAYSLTAPGLPDLPVRGGEVFANSSHRSNYDTFYKAFQPRIGLAYQVSRGLVLRGGYGVYVSTPRSGAAGNGGADHQGYDALTPWLPAHNGVVNDGLLPGARLSDPFPPAGPILPPGTSCGKPSCPQDLLPTNDVGFFAFGPIPSISRPLPYEQAWSLGFQKELPAKIIADVNYIGKKGTHLYFAGGGWLNHLGPDFEQARLAGTVDIADLAQTQVPNPLAPYITNPLSDLSGNSVPKYRSPNGQFHVPFPQFDFFAGDSPPIANSIYHAAQFRIEKGFSNGLQFLVSYTISKSIDTASLTDGGVAWLGSGIINVQNPNNLRAERSLSGFDIPQVLQFSYVYALPIGRGRKVGAAISPVLNAFIGGWQLNGIWRFDNGRPVILDQYSGGVGSAPIPTYGQRPTLNAPLKANHGSHASMVGNYFVNACEFGSTCLDGSIGGAADAPLAATDSYLLGNAPRTYGGVRQPPTRNVSMAVFKEFPMAWIREGMRLEFRAEAFNAFNHPQFDDVDTALGGGSFGTISDMAQPAREIQLGLKFYF
jgi:Carboxypeptidase regulatory-like domain/TonB dependent receptor